MKKVIVTKKVSDKEIMDNLYKDVPKLESKIKEQDSVLEELLFEIIPTLLGRDV